MYGIDILRAAQREIRRLDRTVQARVIERLEQLKENPRAYGTIKLQGEESTYRNRVGDYRIVFLINDELQVITVTHVGHRGDIYRLR